MTFGAKSGGGYYPGPLRQGALGAALVLLLLGSGAGPGSSATGPLDGLPSYEVTEHVPVIRDRSDQAFRRALEAVFRQVLAAALKSLPPDERAGGDYAAWQRGILSRSQDFIASYQVLDHDVREGYLTLSVKAFVYDGKLKEARREALVLSPMIPVRVLVFVDTFALTGSSQVEDIDAGNEAANALQIALLRKGAMIVPAPEQLPWLAGDSSASPENRTSLAAASARTLGAEYVILGGLRRRADNLLVFSAELLSVTSERSIAMASSPVEIQPNLPPQEYFAAPAAEIAALFTRKLQSRVEGAPRETGH